MSHRGVRSAWTVLLAAFTFWVTPAVSQNEDLLSLLGLKSSVRRAAIIQMRRRLQRLDLQELLRVNSNLKGDVDRLSRAKISMAKFAKCLQIEESSDCILLAHPCIEVLQQKVQQSGIGKGSFGELSCPIFLPSEMSPQQIDAIAQRALGAETYFEWGAGGSTETIAPLALRSYSVEHYAPWCQCLRRRPLGKCLRQQFPWPERITCVKTNLNLRSLGRLAGNGANNTHHNIVNAHRAYVDAIESPHERKFDVVLVDGRAHLSCALKALGYVTNTSVLFVNEWPKKYGRHILRYYDFVREIGSAGRPCDPLGSTKCLAELRPKREYCGSRDVYADFVAVNRNFQRSPSNFRQLI